MVWIGHVRNDKFRCDFVTWTFALVAPDWPICTEFSAVRKHSQMHPNITKCNKTWVLCTMVCIGCVRCEKIWREFTARSFALIAPYWPICIEFSAQTKWSQMHQNITNCNKTWSFVLIAPVRPILHRVYCSSETIPNAPKLYEMQQNMSLESNGVDRARS